MLPDLVVVDTRRQDPVQDPLLYLSVVENLQRVEVPASPANNQTKDH